MLFKLVIVIFFTIINTSVYADGISAYDTSMPDPKVIGSAIGTVCSSHSRGVAIGFAARNSNLTLNEILNKLPQNESTKPNRLLQAMRETIIDVYNLPDISFRTMYIYRSQVCSREIVEMSMFPAISESTSKLLECQKNFGNNEDSAALQICIKSVVLGLKPESTLTRSSSETALRAQ